jgi:hypothetical protein
MGLDMYAVAHHPADVTDSASLTDLPWNREAQVRAKSRNPKLFCQWRKRYALDAWMLERWLLESWVAVYRQASRRDKSVFKRLLDNAAAGKPQENVRNLSKGAKAKLAATVPRAFNCMKLELRLDDLQALEDQMEKGLFDIDVFDGIETVEKVRGEVHTFVAAAREHLNAGRRVAYSNWW